MSLKYAVLAIAITLLAIVVSTPVSHVLRAARIPVNP